jgi:DNA-binding transcriptional regulator of glucitol operon
MITKLREMGVLKMWIFMIFMAGAFVLQIVFGYFQLRCFTKEFVRMRKIGKVAIGKKPGVIVAGTIVLFAVDDGGNILDASKMQGVTVMAKFKKLKGYENKNVALLKENDYENENKGVRAAIANAVSNYNTIMGGGEVPQPPSLFQRIKNYAGKVTAQK